MSKQLLKETSKNLVLTFDGSRNSQKRKAACAALLFEELNRKEPIKTWAGTYCWLSQDDELHSTEIELLGLIIGLEGLVKLLRQEPMYAEQYNHVNIFGDCIIVIDILNGAVQRDYFEDFLTEINSWLFQLNKLGFSYTARHIDREHNHAADRLASETLHNFVPKDLSTTKLKSDIKRLNAAGQFVSDEALRDLSLKNYKDKYNRMTLSALMSSLDKDVYCQLVDITYRLCSSYKVEVGSIIGKADQILRWYYRGLDLELSVRKLIVTEVCRLQNKGQQNQLKLPRLEITTSHSLSPAPQVALPLRAKAFVLA